MHKYFVKYFTAILLSIAVTLFVFFFLYELTVNQKIILCAVMFTIISWTVNICAKSISSLILVVFLIFFSDAPVQTVLSFPLSSTFPMILLCYLFSRGIKNAKITEKFIDPILYKLGDTPLKVIIIMILCLFACIYIIPQPLVRLLMLAEIFRSFLNKTKADYKSKEILLFALFEFYIIVNAGMLDADIIFNSTTVNFAGLDITNNEWMKYMLVPTVFYIILTVFIYLKFFHKELKGFETGDYSCSFELEMNSRQVALTILVVITIVFWISKPLHGFSENSITLVAILMMFCLGFLRLSDIKCIDFSTLIFLTAAYSIGGVLIESGIAQTLLSRARPFLPTEFSIQFVLMIILCSMCLHLILGSNTTTLSIAVPCFIVICGTYVSPVIVMFLTYMSLVPHHLLPFHCVGMAIGVGNEYFDNKIILRMGLMMTVMIFASIFIFYIPWWKFIKVL